MSGQKWKKISLISFSLTGDSTARRLALGLQEKNADSAPEIRCDCKSIYHENGLKESLEEWTKREFSSAEALIFIGACGIAVRSIAPYVTSKASDPAVLVIDECGGFVISLLSGHLGGANELALLAAEILGAQPVVTTATDLHRRFAVDVFAKKNECRILNLHAAKEVSAAILAGEPVGFYSEFPYEGELPEGLVLCEEAETRPRVGVAVTIYEGCTPFEETVQVIPRAVTLGMGCKKGTDFQTILTAAIACLIERNINIRSIEKIASISLKKDEPGLIAFAQNWIRPFETFEPEELKAVEGNFTPSAFVNEVTGVDNVCERSAVLGSGGGVLIKKKTGANGVTTALAVRDLVLHF